LLKNDNITLERKSKITSFESAECGSFGDVLGQRYNNGKLKIGVLGLGYFEYWRMYPDLEAIVKKDLEGAYQKLSSSLPEFKLIYPGIVDTLDRADEAGAELAKEKIDVMIVIEGTYIPDFITIHTINRCGTNPLLILFNSQTGHDVCPNDNYMGTMRNSALIGISQLTGSFNKMKLDYEVVVGEISDQRPYDEIRAVVKAYQSVKKLKLNTYGLIGHVFRGMYDLEFDTAKVKGFLGPEVMTIQAEQLITLWEQVSEHDVNTEAQKLFSRFNHKKIDIDDVKRSCRVGLAMKRLYEKYQLDGLCFLGQHYIEKMTGAPARMGASLMMEQDRVMVACEGDIGGLVMMQLLYDFTGNVPLQAEWGQMDRKNNALFLLGHGIASSELGKSPTLTCSPEEWGFKGSGLNYELIMAPGEVTMGHFLNTGESWQMLISEGEAIDFPCLPCDEIHAMVKVASPIEEYVKKVLEKGVAHHLIVAHGNVTEELKKVARFMRIEHEIIK
jgi:L-arabinose isomerase